MANLITSRDESAGSITSSMTSFMFNMFDRDTPTEVEQTKSSLRNKHSESRDGGAGDIKSSPVSETSVSRPERKVNFVSSISRLSTPRNYKSDVNRTELSKVKISALLYEITERTIQLARPRCRAADNEVAQKSPRSKIFKPTTRIFELARPKAIHEPSPKPVSSVSPNALRAIATQRIIELSRPRENRHSKLPRHKALMIHRSSDLRGRDLSTLKQMNYSREEKRVETLENDKFKLMKLLQETLRSISNVGYDARSTWKKHKRGDDESRIPEKSMNKKRKSSIYSNRTDSDRSIVIVDLDLKNDSPFNKSYKFHGSRRRKSSKVKSK